MFDAECIDQSLLYNRRPASYSHTLKIKKKKKVCYFSLEMFCYFYLSDVSKFSHQTISNLYKKVIYTRR